jgi:methionyl-tRNA formyltransferase
VDAAGADAADAGARGRSTADAHGAPGTVVALGRGLAVVTGSGLLALDEAQLAGGRRMPGADLRNGYPGLVGARLS